MSLAEPSEGWLAVTIPTRQHAASLALPSEKTSGQPLLTAHWAWPGVDRHHIKKKKKPNSQQTYSPSRRTIIL